MMASNALRSDALAKYRRRAAGCRRLRHPSPKHTVGERNAREGRSNAQPISRGHHLPKRCAWPREQIGKRDHTVRRAEAAQAIARAILRDAPLLLSMKHAALDAEERNAGSIGAGEADQGDPNRHRHARTVCHAPYSVSTKQLSSRHACTLAARRALRAAPSCVEQN